MLARRLLREVVWRQKSRTVGSWPGGEECSVREVRWVERWRLGRQSVEESSQVEPWVCQEEVGEDFDLLKVSFWL